MAKMIEKTGKTIEEAIAAAVAELGVAQDELEIEVLEEPSKRFLGLFGGTPAKIRATVKIPAPPAVETVVEVEEPARTEEEIPAEKLEPVLEPSPVEEDSPAEEISEPEEISELEPFDRDKVIDAAEKFLLDVFAAMNLEVEIAIEDTEEACYVDLNGKGLGILIGKHGQALDSLQYLLNLAVNRKNEEKIYFILDVEDYRRRRAETVTKLAKSVAERAIKTRKEVKLEPMSRHDRKIIHTTLQDNRRVETHSVGEEPYRYVVVSPKRGGRKN